MTSSNSASMTTTARLRMSMRRFDLSTLHHCRHEHFMVDRVQTHLELPVCFQDELSVADFLELICDPAGPQGAALFKLPRARRGYAQDMDVLPGWHFTGRATLRLNANRRGHLVLDLSLNPTRWINYVPAGVPLEQLATADPATLLYPSLRRRTHGALDGKDNLIERTERLIRLGQSRQLTAIYVAAVERLLTERLVPDEFSELRGRMDISRPRFSSAGYAEIYTEFRTEDAVSLVESLRAKAIALAPRLSWRVFPAPVEGAIERNAASVIIPVTKEVSIAFYAKEINRIRFEVRYKGDVTEHSRHRDMRGHATSLAEVLSGLQPDAAHKLNRLIGAFKMYAATSVTGRTSLFRLTAEIARATGNDPVRADELLSVLGNHSGVTETGNDGVAPPGVVSALVAVGVLTRQAVRHGNANGDGRRFALTPPYAAVAAALREAADHVEGVSGVPTLLPGVAIFH